MSKYQQEVIQAKSTPNGLRKVAFPVVDAVLCAECGELHEHGADTYLSIVGNLTIGGENGAGIRGNSDWKELGIPVHNFCLDKGCLSLMIGRVEFDARASLAKGHKVGDHTNKGIGGGE